MRLVARHLGEGQDTSTVHMAQGTYPQSVHTVALAAPGLRTRGRARSAARDAPQERGRAIEDVWQNGLERVPEPRIGDQLSVCQETD
jgi:hypothetical protein